MSLEKAQLCHIIHLEMMGVRRAFFCRSRGYVVVTAQTELLFGYGTYNIDDYDISRDIERGTLVIDAK